MRVVAKSNHLQRVNPHLHADADVLHDGVDDLDACVIVVEHQAGQQVGQAVQVVVFDVPHAAQALHCIPLDLGEVNLLNLSLPKALTCIINNWSLQDLILE